MKILYFAGLRDAIGTNEEIVAPPPQVSTVRGLLEWLRARSPRHRNALDGATRLRMAVNLDYAGPDDPISAGDEVAFFPPVTGG